MKPQPFADRIQSIADDLTAFQKEEKRYFVTSSFQTHSIPMLHILSQIDARTPIYFLNTGYHFPETIQFRDTVTKALGLNVINARSEVPKNQQRDQEGHLLFASDPDHCCFLNKTQPTDKLLDQHDVWINGVRADQNANRKNLKRIAATPNGKLRYHPMLDWNKKEIYQYIKAYNLPRHPLDENGYVSIGCEPCTRKPTLDDREGRWFGMNKTECGLHTDLIAK